MCTKMQLYSDFNLLNESLAALGSKIKAKQVEAVKDIRNHVEVAARELACCALPISRTSCTRTSSCLSSAGRMYARRLAVYWLCLS